jgi:hypothetical protein
MQLLFGVFFVAQQRNDIVVKVDDDGSHRSKSIARFCCVLFFIRIFPNSHTRPRIAPSTGTITSCVIDAIHLLALAVAAARRRRADDIVDNNDGSTRSNNDNNNNNNNNAGGSNSSAMNVDASSSSLSSSSGNAKPLPRVNWLELFDVDDLFCNASQQFVVDDGAGGGGDGADNNAPPTTMTITTTPPTTTMTSLLQMIVELHDAVACLPTSSSSSMTATRSLGGAATAANAYVTLCHNRTDFATFRDFSFLDYTRLFLSHSIDCIVRLLNEHRPIRFSSSATSSATMLRVVPPVRRSIENIVQSLLCRFLFFRFSDFVSFRRRRCVR